MRAIYDDDTTGARRTDTEKCIGCSACVYACPFGAIMVDQKTGHSFTCHQCDGDPNCVKLCPTQAIEYVDSDNVGMRLRRNSLEKLINYQFRE